MPTEEQLQTGFRLGDWEILPARGEFRRGEEVVRPEPLTLRVLLSLAQREGDLVTRDQLIDDAWGGRATSDDPINRAIGLLRKQLDDRGKPPEYVETLHRRGYRLIKPIQPIADERERPPSRIPKTIKIRIWRVIAGLLAVALISVVVYTGLLGSPPIRSVGVLPFENLSADVADDYLVSGFREELLQTLHNIDDFTVKNARLKYDGEDDDIAGQLGVESLVAGSMRRNGDRLIISYTITKRGKGVIHASEIDGEVSEVFALQEKLANRVRDNLLGKSAQTLIKSRPADSAAYDSYMRGLFALEQRGTPGNLEAAIAMLNDAIRDDAGYGPAYLALASAYALMVDYRDAPLTETNQLALRTIDAGVQADPGITDAAAAIYGYVYYKEKRWQDAEVAYQRAVGADAVDSNAFNWYSRMLASMGRLDAALTQALSAVEIDPSSPVINSRVAIAYTWLDRRDKAHEYFERSFDLGAGGVVQSFAYALLLARDGEFDQAQRVTSLAVDNTSQNTDWIGPLFVALRDARHIDEALNALDAASQRRDIEPQVDLTARAMLGDIEGAMGVAKRLEEPGEAFEMELLFIDELQTFREHPEFLPLLERLGIVDYWSSVGCEWQNDAVYCTSSSVTQSSGR